MRVKWNGGNSNNENLERDEIEVRVQGQSIKIDSSQAYR